jgi:hypothetical protein
MLFSHGRFLSISIEAPGHFSASLLCLVLQVQADELAGRFFEVGGLLLELSRAASALARAADGIPDPLVSNVAMFIQHDNSVTVPSLSGHSTSSMEPAMFGMSMFGSMHQPPSGMSYQIVKHHLSAESRDGDKS